MQSGVIAYVKDLANAGWVFLGAGTGGVLRFLIQGVANRHFPDFPWGTLAINVFGSFLIGVYLGWESGKPQVGAWGFLIPTGLLGGFTTFSAFSGESLKLWHAGSKLPAFGYVTGSVLLALGSCALGLLVFRSPTQ